MRVIIVSDDTRIRTSEGQDYKRTGYLPDHNLTAAVVTNEGQDYKRTVYPLDHNCHSSGNQRRSGLQTDSLFY